MPKVRVKNNKTKYINVRGDIFLRDLSTQVPPWSGWKGDLDVPEHAPFKLVLYPPTRNLAGLSPKHLGLVCAPNLSSYSYPDRAATQLSQDPNESMAFRLRQSTRDMLRRGAAAIAEVNAARQ